MPTDDERREVATKLRRLARKHDGVVPDLVAKHLGLVPDERYIARSVYTSRSASRLADLIEPEPERTCHFVYDEDENEYKCDVCGCFVYFPFCGAMVVNE